MVRVTMIVGILAIGAYLGACGSGSAVPPSQIPQTPHTPTDPAPEVPPPFPPPPPPAPSAWFEPACTTVGGKAVVTFTRDAGATVTANAEPMPAGAAAETWTVAVVPGHGGLLFAAHETDVYRSDDAGCSWQVVETPRDLYSIVATDRWAFDVDEKLHLFHAGGYLGAYPIPFDGMRAIVSAAEPGVFYALARDGQLWRSADQGRNWWPQGAPPPGRAITGLKIDPYNPLHYVATKTSGEPYASFDGGLSWTQATGVMAGATTGGVRGWVFGGTPEATDIWAFVVRYWSLERVFMRSTDGGLTFTEVVANDPPVDVVWPHLNARLGHPGEMYFADGCRLYRYLASDDSLTISGYDCEEFSGVKSIAFHPTNDDLFYFGLRTSESSISAER